MQIIGILNWKKYKTVNIMAGRFLRMFSPFVRITPEVKQPDREISFKDKLIYTFVILLIYIIMSNIPLHGLPLQGDTGVDYYYWLRTILASQRGTLTEMGIGPIVTSGLIMQLLQGAKMIEVNMNDPADRALFTGAQKVIAIFLTLFQIIMYIFGGAFGALGTGDGELGTSAAISIGFQLLFAGILIMLMDEVLQKGYGLGSGVSLFIATGVAGQIFWNAFGPMTQSGEGTDGLYTGIMIAFFQVLFGSQLFPDGHSRAGESIGIGDLWFREANAPGLVGLITTILIFSVVIYIESMRVEIPLTYAGYKGYRGKYPMKLLYVSNIPVILAQALYANFLFIGQLAWNGTSEGSGVRSVVAFFGSFKTEDAAAGGSYLTPTGGILKYLTPPKGLSNIISVWRKTGLEGGDQWAEMGGILLHSLIYLIIFVFICVYFGKIWIEVSGLAPRDIAGQIIDSKMQIPGFRRSDKIIEKILKRYIPTLTIICGIIVGFLSFTADFLGSLSSGTGLLLTVGIVQNYAETISKEAAADQMPGMRGLLGL